MKRFLHRITMTLHQIKKALEAAAAKFVSPEMEIELDAEVVEKLKKLAE